MALQTKRFAMTAMSLACGVAGMAAPDFARAQQTEPDSTAKASEPPPASPVPEKTVVPAGQGTLTGDWGGARTRLAEHGFTFGGAYVTEPFGVVSGGLRKGATYSHQISATMTVDMDKAAGWTGSSFHLAFNERTGKSLSADYIGNYLTVQGNMGNQFARLAEMSFEQKLADGAVDLRLGYFPMGSYVASMMEGCFLVNMSFCDEPETFYSNSNWNNYPDPRWAALAKVRLRPDLFVRTGITQVNPQLSTKRNSFNPFGGKTIGVILPFEVEYAPGKQPGDRVLPGSYKLGFYFDTSNAPRAGRPGEVSSRYVVYSEITQTVLRSANPKRGLDVMAGASFYPDASALATRSLMFGLVKRGTFHGRDADSIGLGVIHSIVNKRLRDAYLAGPPPVFGLGSLPAGETVIEANYGLQLAPWLNVQPDLQYIFDPGAFSFARRGDAVVVGGKVSVQF